MDFNFYQLYRYNPVGTEHLLTSDFTNIAEKNTRKYGNIWEDSPETQKPENAEKNLQYWAFEKKYQAKTEL